MKKDGFGTRPMLKKAVTTVKSSANIERLPGANESVKNALQSLGVLEDEGFGVDVR